MHERYKDYNLLLYRAENITYFYVVLSVLWREHSTQ